MAEQVLIQFRADKSLKQEVSAIYEALGLDLPTAFRIFMKQSVLSNGLPFSVTLPKQEGETVSAKTVFHELRRQAAEAGIPEMSLDEINAEIAEVRRDRKQKKEQVS